MPGPLESLAMKGHVMGRLTMLVPKPDGFEALVRVYSRFAYVRELVPRCFIGILRFERETGAPCAVQKGAGRGILEPEVLFHHPLSSHVIGRLLLVPCPSSTHSQ